MKYAAMKYAACGICKQLMKPKQGCLIETVICNGKKYKRIPAGDALEFYSLNTNNTCRDCKTGEGQFHHFNCGAEVCPHCHELLIYCICEADFEEVE